MSTRILQIVLILLVGSFQRLALAETPDGNSCVSCHSDIWEEVSASIHSQQGVFCQDCHGGNPAIADKDLAKAAGTGYIGIPDKAQIAKTCGECHADVEKMNFYGIRTDQLARYKTSVHGKKLLGEGDTRVAACTDCHGYHDVVSVADPSSPVYPLNLPETCDRCHGKEKLMDAYGLPSDILETYKKSVHGVALFEKKDLSAANCVSCHGSHGAVPPGVREISAACGKCHINERKYFLESVHAEPMKEGKFSECISCHGNHGVQPASPALYRDTCLQCHEAGGIAVGHGNRLMQMLNESSGALDTAKSEVKNASIEGIFVEEETSLLEEARTKMIEMAPLQHSLAVPKITELHEQITALTEKVKDKVRGKRESLKWRKIMLIPLWMFVAVMVIALRAKYQALKKKK